MFLCIIFNKKNKEYQVFYKIIPSHITLIEDKDSNKPNKIIENDIEIEKKKMIEDNKIIENEDRHYIMWCWWHGSFE